MSSNQKDGYYNFINSVNGIFGNIGTSSFILGYTGANSTFKIDGSVITSDDWKKLKDSQSVTPSGGVTIGGVTIGGASGANGSSGGTKLPNPTINIDPTGGITIYASGATYTPGISGALPSISGTTIFNINTTNGTTSITGGSFITYSIDGQYRDIMNSNSIRMTDQFNGTDKLLIDINGDSSISLKESDGSKIMIANGITGISLYDASDNLKFQVNRFTGNMTGNVINLGSSVGSIQLDPTSNSQLVVKNISNNKTFEIGNNSVIFYDNLGRSKTALLPDGSWNFLEGINIFQYGNPNEKFIINPGYGLKAYYSPTDVMIDAVFSTRIIAISGTVNIAGTLNVNGVPVVGGGGGGTYNQNLNTTGAVSFKSLTISDPLYSTNAFLLKDNAGNTRINIDSNGNYNQRRSDNTSYFSSDHNNGKHIYLNTAATETVQIVPGNAATGGTIHVRSSGNANNIVLSGESGNIFCTSINSLYPFVIGGSIYDSSGNGVIIANLGGVTSNLNFCLTSNSISNPKLTINAGGNNITAISTVSSVWETNISFDIDIIEVTPANSRQQDFIQIYDNLTFKSRFPLTFITGGNYSAHISSTFITTGTLNLIILVKLVNTVITAGINYNISNFCLTVKELTK